MITQLINGVCVEMTLRVSNFQLVYRTCLEVETNNNPINIAALIT